MFGPHLFDPSGLGRIGGHYFHAWCPYVRTYEKTKLRYNPNVAARKTIYALRRTPCMKNNGHLLAGAWWVTLNSLDFYTFFWAEFGKSSFDLKRKMFTKNISRHPLEVRKIKCKSAKHKKSLEKYKLYKKNAYVRWGAGI